jgi:glycosyltransferase involved in cell wall biosynthesis
MRILYLTHYFQPEPIFWALPLAKAFVRQGHQVQVLTSFPNYPGGKVYEGYKIKLLQKEIMDGIDVIRVPLYPSHDNSSLKRIVCYASFGLSASTVGLWATKKADVAYIMQGPMTLGIPALMLKLIKRMPFVIHIQDLWPDSLLSTGMFNNKFGLKMLDAWCYFVYRHAAKIITITPGMKNRLIKRGISGDKIEVIYNWCDCSQICPAEKNEELAKSLGMAARFNFVFAGNLGRAQALEPVLDAAALLKVAYPKIQFVFIGSGVAVEDLKKKAADLGLKNVLFLPRRPANEIGPILSLADVLFVHLKKDPLFEITIPSKTQAYLAMGRPILIGVEGDAADLVQRAGAGIPCEPENPHSIASAAESLYLLPEEQRRMMARAGAEYYERELSFQRATDRYEIIFKEISQTK